MKYIAGIIIGLVLGGVGVVYAKNSGMEIVNQIDVGSYGRVWKIYDNDNNTVCYAYKHGYAGGISCVK